MLPKPPNREGQTPPIINTGYATEWRKHTRFQGPGMNLAELRDAAEDRDVWRKLTMSIARALRAVGTGRQGEQNWRRTGSQSNFTIAFARWRSGMLDVEQNV